MRNQVERGRLALRAIAGTRVVLLAVSIAEAARPGLLGFAIGRVGADGVDWLKGRKAFASVVPAPDPHQSFGTNEHPIQSLIWADYAARPGRAATYRVQPVYGSPGAPVLGEGADIDVTTEDPASGVHGIHVNRGTIASQAFSERFQNRPPEDADDPSDGTVRWLARGMLDAALAFIDRAQAGDALHVAAYEFTYRPILLALKAAAGRGVTVRIVHEAGQARDPKTKARQDTEATIEAREAISALGLDRQPGLTLIPRTRRRGIPHNKFIVWSRAGQPAEVLGGSANFTPSGFIGQTNVVHIVREPAVARAYLDCWDHLALDPATPELARWSEATTPQADLDRLTAAAGITPLFSPRRNDAMLGWYAGTIARARQTVMLTAAFGVNKTLAAEFAKDRPFVRFLLLEDEPDRELKAKLAGDRDVLAAYGSLLGAYASGKKTLPRTSLDHWFLREELFRREGHVFFIHTKFLLIDPLGDDPLVCTGSANFSSASLKDNDENMLLIRGDTQVADIYLTEFDRIFRHFWARQTIDRLAAAGKPLAQAKFLSEDDGWLDGYVRPGGFKTNRQRLFFPDWPG